MPLLKIISVSVHILDFQFLCLFRKKNQLAITGFPNPYKINLLCSIFKAMIKYIYWYSIRLSLTSLSYYYNKKFMETEISTLQVRDESL